MESVTSKFGAIGISLVLVVLFYLLIIDARSQDLMAVHDCVIEKAQAEKYLDPYSEEAWKLFAPLCK